MTGIEPTPSAAEQLFGPRLDLATSYAQLLVSAGVERGLVGPREAERIWSRHVLNCAALAEAFPADARVVDVGSGAGLPGLVLAIARPDLTVDLVEPLARRAAFLSEAVEHLSLTQVRVMRGRAEERAVLDQVGSSEWVTARAVAPLDRLVAWCLPLLVTGGRLVAMKGSQAQHEVDEHRSVLTRLGVTKVEVREFGRGVVDPAVTAVIAERGAARTGPRGKTRKSKGKS